MFNVDSGGANVYNGYDQFGQTARSGWYNYASGNVLRDRFDHLYDYAGNQLTRKIPSALIGYLDYAYEYDGLNRLKQYQQGTLSGTTITGGSLSYQELWTLDQLGNWADQRCQVPSTR